MNMRNICIAGLTICVLLSSIMLPASGAIVEEEYFIVQYESDIVELDENQEGILKFNITNNWNQSLGFHLEWIFVECGDLTHGEFTEDFFYLQPNETKEVELHLTGSDNAPQGCEDGVISISWGRNLSQESWGGVDWSTKDGDRYIGIDIVRNLSIVHHIKIFTTVPYCFFTLILAVVIIILLALYFKRRNQGNVHQSTDADALSPEQSEDDGQIDQYS